MIVQNDAKKKSNFGHLGDNAEHPNRVPFAHSQYYCHCYNYVKFKNKIKKKKRILRSFEHERESRESNLSTS